MGMSSITNLWSKEYVTGINDAGQRTTKSLNIFQRIARRCFGYYQETHLEKALRALANTFTKPNFHFAEGEALKVKNLFNKIYVRTDPWAGSLCQSRTLLVRKIDDIQGRSLKFSLHYSPNDEYPTWSVRAAITDENMNDWTIQMYLNKDINSNSLVDSGVTSGCPVSRNDNEAKNLYIRSVKGIMNEFLNYTVKNSHVIEGVKINSRNKVISKLNASEPVSFVPLNLFSLDFILYLADA